MTAAFRICLACSALGLAAPASTSPPQAPENPDILVTGTREFEAQMRDFVEALTQAPSNGQIGRFERTVCPTVAGVPQDRKEAIISRMRRVAEAAGVTVGSPACLPNVVLFVTADKRRFLETLLQQQPYYFGAMTPEEVRRMAASSEPAAAWHVRGSVSADGSPFAPDGNATAPDPMDIGPVNGAGGFVSNRTTRPPSRIRAAARPEFIGAVVVVDSHALVGLTNTQLADYAVMRALAPTNPAQLTSSAVPTILRVLDAPMGSEVPVTLTRWDLGFLKALYSSPQNLRAAAQRSEIRRRLQTELGQASTPNQTSSE